jgi:anti-sigma28 factor (negative regulator of flagellin synthesis)
MRSCLNSSNAPCTSARDSVGRLAVLVNKRNKRGRIPASPGPGGGAREQDTLLLSIMSDLSSEFKSTVKGLGTKLNNLNNSSPPTSSSKRHKSNDFLETQLQVKEQKVDQLAEELKVAAAERVKDLKQALKEQRQVFDKTSTAIVNASSSTAAVGDGLAHRHHLAATLGQPWMWTTFAHY